MSHTKLTRWFSLIAAVAALGLSLAVAAPASAASITISQNCGGLGETCEFQATGFQNNEIVDTWVGLPNLSAVSTGTYQAAGGSVSFDFYVDPSYGGGEYIAVAHGRVSGEVSTKFVVSAPPSSSTDNNVTPPPPAPIAPVSERTVAFSGSGYRPGEIVSTWYMAPNGAVTAYQDFTADAWGNLSFNFTVPANWMFGGYQLVGRGMSSGNTAYITFSFFGTVSDVRANKPITTQTPYFDFWQGGFIPGEQVSLWLGLPNGTTQALGIVNATAGGNAYYRVFLTPSSPYGGYIVAAYGWKSQKTLWQRFSYFGEVNRLYP